MLLFLAMLPWCDWCLRSLHLRGFPQVSVMDEFLEVLAVDGICPFGAPNLCVPLGLLKPSGWQWSCSCVDNPQSCPPYIWTPSCLRNAVAAPSLRGFPISPCCWAFRFGGQSVAEEEWSWASFPCRRGAQLSCRAPLPPLYHQPSWSHHSSAVCLCQGEIYAPCTLLRTTLKLNSSEGNQLCFIPAVVMEWRCVVWRFHKYLCLKLLPSCALCFSPLK